MCFGFLTTLVRRDSHGHKEEGEGPATRLGLKFRKMITQINNSKFSVFHSSPFHLDLLREIFGNCSGPEMGLREPWLCTGQTTGMVGRGFWVKCCGLRHSGEHAEERGLAGGETENPASWGGWDRRLKKEVCGGLGIWGLLLECFEELTHGRTGFVLCGPSE